MCLYFSLHLNYLISFFYFSFILHPKFRGKNSLFCSTMVLEEGVCSSPLHSSSFLILCWFCPLSSLVPCDPLKLPLGAIYFESGSIWCHKFGYKFILVLLSINVTFGDTCLPYVCLVLYLRGWKKIKFFYLNNKAP